MSCEAIIYADVGTHNLRGGNGRGIRRYRRKQCGHRVRKGQRYCYLHRKGGPYDQESKRRCRRHGKKLCDCRPSSCCSQYTHGCSPMEHKFYDPTEFEG